MKEGEKQVGVNKSTVTFNLKDKKKVNQILKLIESAPKYPTQFFLASKKELFFS